MSLKIEKNVFSRHVFDKICDYAVRAKIIHARNFPWKIASGASIFFAFEAESIDARPRCNGCTGQA